MMAMRKKVAKKLLRKKLQKNNLRVIECKTGPLEGPVFVVGLQLVWESQPSQIP